MFSGGSICFGILRVKGVRKHAKQYVFNKKDDVWKLLSELRVMSAQLNKIECMNISKENKIIENKKV